MDATPAEAGVEHEAAAPGETSVRRRRARKPKVPDWHEKVRVRNLTDRKITAQSGSLLPRGEGQMKRLDAVRLERYVEIIDAQGI